jgi:hypothetical protein
VEARDFYKIDEKLTANATCVLQADPDEPAGKEIKPQGAQRTPSREK